MIQVGIVMGSDNNWPAMRQATNFLEEFGVGYKTRVVSAHHTPNLVFEYAETAHSRDIKVIIADVDGAARLPGIMAARTTVPVLGMSTPSKYLCGEDSLLSIMQMPKDISVATFAIGKTGVTDAALFVVSMLANEDAELARKLAEFHGRQEQSVLAMELPAR